MDSFRSTWRDDTAEGVNIIISAEFVQRIIREIENSEGLKSIEIWFSCI